MKNGMIAGAMGFLALALSGCLDESATQTIDGGVALTSAEMKQITGREYVCFDIDGVAFPGVYDMYIDTDVKVPGGGRADFLAGFYVNGEPGQTSSYGEGYHGGFVSQGENIVISEGVRIIPSDAPDDIDSNTKFRTVNHRQTFAFYKRDSFPKTIKVATTFLDQGRTVLGCESIGGRPKWMRLFDSVIQAAVDKYKPAN